MKRVGNNFGQSGSREKCTVYEGIGAGVGFSEQEGEESKFWRTYPTSLMEAAFYNEGNMPLLNEETDFS